ncbi:heme ABC transporter ATP-binding protein [Kaistia algarum]|uniref:ABC transporter ATP-binding protein n=1 Tax=Kaistia algarum TaxID=2083279 RepID=UPI000CE7D085|nr:ABC transporter ATP-binding protein [Kaistia algarum]MCX5512925.1 ABC transporter ATP-binding protein [Kaistia algarum]PPE81587.1 heme ABC transporter ATP-binding protein [Kaistia algarum]
MPPAPPFLTLSAIAKRFGDKVALEHVDLSVAAGEVHVVAGENGAGKSTLMNILVGIHQPSGGTMALRGETITVPDPIAASRLGIGMVHQHFMLVPSMSVAENLFLGRQPRRFGLLTDRAGMRRRAAELVERYGFRLDVDAPVGTLSVGQRQRVEILKALAFDAELLILDEPTAVLTPPEVDELLVIIDALRARGRTVLFITHKLREVKEVSDRVTVLRLGKSIGTHRTADISEREIAREMVGRDVFLVGRKDDGKARSFGTPALSLSGVTMTEAHGRRRLDSVSLDVRAGEIVGIAGVDGNGQTELAEAIVGLMPIQAGRIAINGHDVGAVDVSGRYAAGLGFIPEDRLDRGLSATMSIAENVAATNYERAGLVRHGLVSTARRDAFASAKISEFDVRGAKPSIPVGWLSGGNMQKVVIARELARSPKVLVVAQPTRGLDIGASEFVYARLMAAADSGCAVLLISSELSEVFALSDRIGVMYSGRLVHVFDRKDADETRIGYLMNGGKPHEMGEAA